MTPKLLLADDSVTIQRVIELTFADENVQVIAVGDGHQAIERIRSERPDIVLADVGMPERDGYEVASFVKGTPEYAHIPVLLLTGAFEPVDEGRARSLGCDGVLVKPFEPQMVITRVRELLSRKPQSAPSPAPAQPRAAEASPPARPAAPAESPKIGFLELDKLEPPTSGAAPRDALEDYFDRLDAALASISSVPPPPIVEEAPPGELNAPYPAAASRRDSQPEIVLNSGHTLTPKPPAPPPAPSGERSTAPRPPAATPTPAPPQAPAARTAATRPAPARVTSPEPPVSLAGTSSALHEAFAALLSAEQRRPVAPALGEPMSEEAIDAIVSRVVTRMKDDEMRRLVLDTAERLVREEIDRIKSLR